MHSPNNNNFLKYFFEKLNEPFYREEDDHKIVKSVRKIFQKVNYNFFQAYNIYLKSGNKRKYHKEFKNCYMQIYEKT